MSIVATIKSHKVLAGLTLVGIVAFVVWWMTRPETTETDALAAPGDGSPVIVPATGARAPRARVPVGGSKGTGQDQSRQNA